MMLVVAAAWWLRCCLGAVLVLAGLADANLYVLKRIPGKKDAKKISVKLRDQESISHRRLIRTLGRKGLSAQHLPSLGFDEIETPMEMMRLSLEFFQDYFNDEQLYQVTQNAKLSGVLDGSFTKELELVDAALMSQKLNTIQTKLGLLNAATLGDRIDAIIEALPPSLYRFLNPLTALMSPRFKATVEGFARLFYLSGGVASDLTTETAEAVRKTLQKLADLGTGHNRIFAAAGLLRSLVTDYPDLAKVFKERVQQLQGELGYFVSQIREKVYQLEAKMTRQAAKTRSRKHNSKTLPSTGSRSLDKVARKVDELSAKVQGTEELREALENFRDAAENIREQTKDASENFVENIDQVKVFLGLTPERFEDVLLLVQNYIASLLSDLMEWSSGVHFLSINMGNNFRSRAFSLPSILPSVLRPSSPQEKILKLFDKMASKIRDVINVLFSLRGVTIRRKKGHTAHATTQLLVGRLLQLVPPAFERTHELVDRVIAHAEGELRATDKRLTHLAHRRSKQSKIMRHGFRELERKAARLQKRAAKRQGKSKGKRSVQVNGPNRDSGEPTITTGCPWAQDATSEVGEKVVVTKGRSQWTVGLTQTKKAAKVKKGEKLNVYEDPRSKWTLGATSATKKRSSGRKAAKVVALGEKARDPRTVWTVESASRKHYSTKKMAKMLAAEEGGESPVQNDPRTEWIRGGARTRRGTVKVASKLAPVGSKSVPDQGPAVADSIRGKKHKVDKATKRMIKAAMREVDSSMRTSMYETPSSSEPIEIPPIDI